LSLERRTLILHMPKAFVPRPLTNSCKRDVSSLIIQDSSVDVASQLLQRFALAGHRYGFYELICCLRWTGINDDVTMLLLRALHQELSFRGDVAKPFSYVQAAFWFSIMNAPCDRMRAMLTRWKGSVAVACTFGSQPMRFYSSQLYEIMGKMGNESTFLVALHCRDMNNIRLRVTQEIPAAMTDIPGQLDRVNIVKIVGLYDVLQHEGISLFSEDFTVFVIDASDESIDFSSIWWITAIDRGGWVSSRPLIWHHPDTLLETSCSMKLRSDIASVSHGLYRVRGYSSMSRLTIIRNLICGGRVLNRYDKVGDRDWS
jgi:hypothetical protein